MKNKKQIQSAEFKARVALDAIKGIEAGQELAVDHQLHPTQVTQWKSRMLAGASEVFEQGRGRKIQEEAVEEDNKGLERKIGQLVVEVDWLSRKRKELGIDP